MTRQDWHSASAWRTPRHAYCCVHDVACILTVAIQAEHIMRTTPLYGFLYHAKVLEVDVVDAADVTPDAFWQRYVVRTILCPVHSGSFAGSVADWRHALCRDLRSLFSCRLTTGQWWSVTPCPQRWAGPRRWIGARLR
jgi:hypothetical protein